MKTVILAGGLGTRLAEETVLKPKPMVDVGGKPILWHILNIYGSQSFSEFVLALGYKGEFIKEYFMNFFALNNDFSVNLASGERKFHGSKAPNWNVHLIDTGLNTMTGGRILQLRDFLKEEQTFMVTYGDGVSDIDVRALVEFHKRHGKIATVSCVRPPARFGSIALDGKRVQAFHEKPQLGEGWINGGFFVFNKQIFDYIAGDSTSLEKEPLENLTKDGQLMAYEHSGFWQMMDTIRDKQYLETLWNSGKAPWVREGFYL